MKKMPTLFERDETVRGGPVKNAVREGCEWVLAGEGEATRKIDGQNVKVAAGVLYKRQKPKNERYDEASYVECKREDPGDKYLFEAFDRGHAWSNGVYECIGPKVQGNPERHTRHDLVRVCTPEPGLYLAMMGLPGLTFEALREWLDGKDIEGIVFHRNPNDPDCDKAKIKKKDFGMKR